MWVGGRRDVLDSLSDPAKVEDVGKGYYILCGCGKEMVHACGCVGVCLLCERERLAYLPCLSFIAFHKEPAVAIEPAEQRDCVYRACRAERLWL